MAHSVEASAQGHDFQIQMSKRPPVYPFTAIVGQDMMKLALILNAIDMRIGGVLIRGERGTGKVNRGARLGRSPAGDQCDRRFAF